MTKKPVVDVSTLDSLRALVDVRQMLQKSRVAFGNRTAAIERGSDNAEPETHALLARWEERFQQLEDAANEDISFVIGDNPLVESMIQVKGVGQILAAKIIALVDIQKADTVSSLWSYAGYGLSEYWMDGDGSVKAPKSGWQWKKTSEDKKEKVFVEADQEPGWKLVVVRDRAVEGWVLPYNRRLKTSLYVLAGSFLKSNSPYRAIYDDAKAYYQEARPDWTKAHRHNAALRKMMKVWLSHLWEVWRKMEGLPTREIYVQEKLGHTHVLRPEQFGWPEM